MSAQRAFVLSQSFMPDFSNFEKISSNGLCVKVPRNPIKLRMVFAFLYHEPLLSQAL